MVTVNKLISNIRTTEIDSVSGNIIAEYNKSDWSGDAHLTGIFDLLKPASESLTKAINRIKAESDLEEKDEQRDSKVRAVHYLIMGYLHHPDETINSAAQTVDAVFEHYGVDIVSESYSTESSLIESLLIEFAKEDLQTAIAALPGLSDLIDGLSAAQTAFGEAQLLFEEEKAKEGTEENATKIKKEVTTIINDKLVVYLRAMVQVDETKYGELTGTVAQIIDDMNVIVKKRRKTSEPSVAATE